MPMTREEAEQLLAANPELGRGAPSREQAVVRLMQLDKSQVPLSAGAAIRPQSAIAAGVLGEPPKMVTPASPAPVRPGVPVMAPRPEAAQLPQPAVGGPLEKARAAQPPAPAADVAPPPPAPQAPAPEGQRKPSISPERIAANQARRDLELITQVIEEIRSSGQEPPAEAKLRLDLAQRKAQTLEAEANAVEAAQIDPEVAAIIERQKARVAEEEQRITADKARAPWEALTAGGLALMNPQRGANFLAALGQGLNVGLETYDTARAQAAERKARLGERSDQIALQGIDALTKARQAARDAIRRGEEVDERTLQIANLTNENIVKTATRQATIDKAIAEASKAQTDARYAGPLAESEIAYRRDMGKAALARGESGGEGVSPTTLFNAAEEAKEKAIEYQGKVREKFQAWKESEKGLNFERSGPEWNAYMAELRTYKYLRKRAGLETVLPDLSPKYINRPNPAPKAKPKAAAPAQGGSKVKNWNEL